MMPSGYFTPKQLQMVRMLKKNQFRRLNILYGSVRSGKTYITLLLWAMWVATMPHDKNYLMCAKTLTSLKRNCLDLLQSLIGEENFDYSISAKQGKLFGRKIYLEGANDARSESKIRGMSLSGAYIDEITLIEEDFFTMLLSRLSDPGAKLFGSTNPAAPSHWLKEKYIDRKDELDLFVDKFVLDDNTFLDKKYVEQIKKEYTGVFYERFILGDFVAAEGLVYPMFDKGKHLTDKVLQDGQFYISIDYGTINPFAAGLWCVEGKKAVMIDEYYYESKKTHQAKTDEEHYKQIEKLAQNYPVQEIIIDPSASSFKETIRRHDKFDVINANNNVISGIADCMTLLDGGYVKFSPKCTGLIKEMGLYSWDKDAKEDAVIKEYDHSSDQFRYFVSTILRREWYWFNWEKK